MTPYVVARSNARHNAMGKLKSRILEAQASSEQAGDAWASWNAQRADARESWEHCRSTWWRKQCDGELFAALSKARRGEGEAAMRVTWALERTIRAEMELSRRTGVLSASAQTIANRAGVSRRTVVAHNKLLEAAGVLRRHSSGGAKFDEEGKIVETAANVYRFSHQQLRRLLGVPLRGHSVYEARKAATPQMQKLQDALALAYERRIVSRFHVCSKDASPWHDERGFCRMWKTGKKAARRLCRMWKTTRVFDEMPVPGRVCTVNIDKTVERTIQGRKTRLSQGQGRLARAIDALRSRGLSPLAHVVEAISRRSETEALFSAIDALAAAAQPQADMAGVLETLRRRAVNLNAIADMDFT